MRRVFEIKDEELRRLYSQLGGAKRLPVQQKLVQMSREMGFDLSTVEWIDDHHFSAEVEDDDLGRLGIG